MPAEKRSTPQQQHGVRSRLELVLCRKSSQRNEDNSRQETRYNISFAEGDTVKCKKTANHFQGYRTKVLRKISAVKVGTKIASESARIIGASCRHELRIAPRWSRNSLPRRILDEIWRRDRKNEQRGAEKPILRKTASRTDETAPVLEKNGFFHVRLNFTPLRRQLAAFPATILEITSSYGGIFPDMPCMKRVFRDKKAFIHWSAARKKERFSSRA